MISEAQLSHDGEGDSEPLSVMESRAHVLGNGSGGVVGQGLNEGALETTQRRSAPETENGGPTDLKQLTSAVSPLNIEEGDGRWTENDEELLTKVGILPPAHEHFTLGTSALPLRSKLFNNGFIPIGGMYVPFSTYGRNPSLLRHPPVVCSRCGAAASSNSQIYDAFGKWACVFCSQTNINSEDAAILNTLSRQGSQVSTLDYIIGSAYELSTNIPDLYHSDSIQPSVIFVIDQCMPRDQLQFLQASLLALVRRLPPEVRIGLITYSNSISFFDLTKSELTTTLTLPADQGLTRDYIEDLIYGSGEYIGPVNRFSDALETCIRGLRSHDDDSSANRRNSYLAPALQAAIAIITNSDEILFPEDSSKSKESGTVETKTTVRMSEPFATGGYRVQAEVRGNLNGTIAVCLASPANLSSRSARLRNNEIAVLKEEMEAVAELASTLRVCIDVHIGGHRPVNLSVLEPLTKETGGCLMMDEVFGESFCTNVEHFVRHRLPFPPELSIRLSHPLQLVRLIGPKVMEVDMQNYYRKVPTYLLWLSAMNKNQGYAVFLESSANISREQVYIQFSLKFVNDNMERVCRVTTVTISTCNGAQELMPRIDCGVTAVLIAKRTLIELNTIKDTKACLRRLQERKSGITNLFGPRRGYFGLMRRRSTFPQVLRSLKQHLFFFENGPILGSLGLSLDERLALRHHLLHADLITSLRMLHQRAFVISDHQRKIQEEVPTSNILNSESVIIIDHGSDILVWIGSMLLNGAESTSDAKVDRMKRFAERIAAERYPRPRIILTFEGTSQARYALCRLGDLHLLQRDLDN